MDMTIETYVHEVHLAYFWPIFAQYWQEVNGININEMTNEVVNGKIYVTTLLEQKLFAILKEKKIKAIFNSKQECLGFIQYKPFLGPKVMLVDALYIKPECRQMGLATFLFSTFTDVEKVLFECHKDIPPTELLDNTATLTKIGPTGDRDLVLWQADFKPGISIRQANNKLRKA